MSTSSTPESVARSRLTTVAALLSILIVAVAAQCKPATGPTIAEYRGKSPTLKRADAMGKLLIGVQSDLPLLSEHNDKTDIWTGFDIDIARLLARELGFAPSMVAFVPLTTEKRISALQQAEVHLVVADFTMTPERMEYVRFAGPYLVTTPEIMVRKADRDKVKTVDDLRNLRVCTTGGSTSLTVLQEFRIEPRLVTRGAECAEGLLTNTYDAHCTDEVVIAGRVHRNPDLYAKVDMPFSGSDPLGIGLPKDDPYLEGLVAHYLRKQFALGANSEWQAIYNANLSVALGPKSQPLLIGDYPVLTEQEGSRA